MTTAAHMSAHAHAPPPTTSASPLVAAMAMPLTPVTPSSSASSSMTTTDDDAAAMLAILDMDLDMAIPDIAASLRSTTSSSNSVVVGATSSSVTPPHLASSASLDTTMTPVKSQTCASFLHIMKAFAESSCNASEMVERVDSLVHQDAQLLKLLPLTQSTDVPISPTGSFATDRRLPLPSPAPVANSNRRPRDLCSDRTSNSSTSSSSSLDVMDLVLDDLSSDSSAASPRSVDLARPLRRKASCDLPSGTTCDMNSDGAAAFRAAKRLKPNESTPTALPATTDDVARWIDLEMELTPTPHDSSDVFAFPQQQPAAAAVAIAAAVKTRASDASLFDDVGMSDSDVDDVRSTEQLASTQTGSIKTERPLLKKRDAADADDDSDAAATERFEPVLWGRDDDAYEQELLSSIDHSVLCDRENRFLQWDLELEAQQQQQQLAAAVASSPVALSSGALTPLALSPIGASIASAAASPVENDATVGPTSIRSWPLTPATSPLSHQRSPSALSDHATDVDDWATHAVDFGTFQHRTVSHILSSCLHKRKLHHPYKHQVKLVNFNVSGDAAIADPIDVLPKATGRHFTSPTTGSTALHDSGAAVHLRTSAAAAARQTFALYEQASTTGSLAHPAGFPVEHRNNTTSNRGEKKQKKREERKRLMSLKMQETFADLESTFTEQDLDFKNVAGAGSLSKGALAKLESLPLPELTNLPADLKELKRKIEATEFKVEGTKHRHRKGGPCPRCQVQNQLRAAKRAYHKRAVAHKKLSPGSGPTPAMMLMTQVEAEATEMLLQSPPVTPPRTSSSSSSSSLVMMPSTTTLKATIAPSPASPAMTINTARAAAAPRLPTIATATSFLKPTMPPPAALPSSLVVAVGSAANAALQQHANASSGCATNNLPVKAPGVNAASTAAATPVSSSHVRHATVTSA